MPRAAGQTGNRVGITLGLTPYRGYGIGPRYGVKPKVMPTRLPVRPATGWASPWV
ncbi:hypothetical protein MAHJHV35_48120 [Mycobacterium avium subsp. hominissuis]